MFVKLLKIALIVGTILVLEVVVCISTSIEK